MLWTCLYFPTLPLQVFVPGYEQPLAISDSDSIFICNAEARDSGIKAGMKLAAAFALDSRLKVFPRDEAKELAALKGIALWAGQFTPTVSLAPPSAVLLEIGGCFSLFGGLNRLLQKMRAGSREVGYDVVMSSAAAPSAALLLARAGLQLHEVRQLEKQIGPLPVALLDIAPDILQSLEAIGMRTISDVLALPRGGLARRFGQELLDTLDRVLGNLPDPRPPFVPPAGYANKLELMAPVHDAEALLFAAKRLIGELTGFLSAKGAGVLKINLDLYHDDESVTRVPFTLSLATRDAAHLTSILRERLFNLTLPQRVEAIALEACEIVPLRSRNFSLFGDRVQERENRAALIERLQARLGIDAVVKLRTFPDHRPELAWRFASESRKVSRASLARYFARGGFSANGLGRPSAIRDMNNESESPSSFLPPPRPLWLLDPPRLLKQGTIIEYSGQLGIPSPLEPALSKAEGGEGQSLPRTRSGGEGKLFHSPSPPPLSPQGRGDYKSSLTLLSGPERIESGWWDGNEVVRDYFVACDSEGAKFWLFLEHVYVNHPSLRGAVYRGPREACPRMLQSGRGEAISKSYLNRDRHPLVEAGVAMTERRWFLHGIFA